MLLIQQRQNVLRSGFHQRRIRAGFHVQAHHRLGIGGAQVKAPLWKRHADAVGAVNFQRVNGKVLLHAGNRLGGLRQLAVALTGANTVPTGSPIIAGPAFEAQVSTVGMPETAATRAASSLVTMPPVPTLEPEPETWMSPSASITLGTYSTRREPGCEGGAVYSASTSVSSTKASARTRLATNAESRSLSPKRISFEANESFS